MPGGATLTYHTYCPYLMELVPSLVLSTPTWNHVHSSFLAMKSCQEQRRHRNMVSLRHPFGQPFRRLNIFNRLVHIHATRLCFLCNTRLLRDIAIPPCTCN